MSMDWQAGDLAMCIHNADWNPLSVPRAESECPSIIVALAPTKGTIWKVSSLETRQCDEWMEGTVTFLHLEGQPTPYAYNSHFFVKVSGQENAEVCEERAEVIEA
ncbi:MAG: hypothetical protein COC10_07460 [Sphingobium sp.]|jgi:hypothetical protein|nr:MAG: hypothetical protein COC10_07460 [Sphingobium sp.]